MEQNTTQEELKQKRSVQDKLRAYGSTALELLKIILVALAIVVPIRYFLFQPFIVKGESMAPNFESGDYLIVDEISYRFSTPQRGDVMVFDYPKDTTQRFIKRVIGLPGETVVVANGSVQITDKSGKTFTLNEKYLPDSLKTYGTVNTKLTDGQYFVLGDNRTYSYDSRIWGVVPSNDIIGKPLLRLFPLTSISKIKTPSY